MAENINLETALVESDAEASPSKKPFLLTDRSTKFDWIKKVY